MAPSCILPTQIESKLSPAPYLLNILPAFSVQMAARGMGIALVLIPALVAMLLGGAAAQSSSCTSVIVSMSPCLNYITGNSSTPSSSCCSQLASVVKSTPRCLCEVLNGGASSLGIQINQTRALALPNSCSVQTPPVSQCNTVSPTASPAGTPDTKTTPATPDAKPESKATPAVPSVPSGAGSKTVPSTNGNTSDGSSTKLTFSLLFVLLFSASYVSTFNSF
ncbi:PREDICTED: non-specific lipid-transfer protein-like protein At2g13820 [Nelumbo nucifera]|uniref:Non-specific lipid-transfer protein-like protein At2g13820 n=1 Tax=Nelumbo nucifera TaxID=4432 RepID=A0A1U8A2T4_NELNU|nr:PREDICTED: non-specific lipid-transfer protein-like protein At2g13820 [Nelumbo nucifera]